MKELLIIGVGNMGRPYLAAARDLGVRVRVVESQAWLGEVLPDEGTLEIMPGVNLDNRALDEVWVGGAYHAVAGSSPDGVLAFAEQHVLAAALVQNLLGVPGPSLHAAVLSRNKAFQRARFAASGIPQPRYHVAADIATGAQWAKDMLPVVVKPVSSSGSFGVELVTDQAGLDDCVRRRAGGGMLLVEEAISGPEYSWEGFVRDGNVLFGNITEKETTPPPHFVEVAHRCGHRFTQEGTRSAVEALVVDTIAAICVHTGVVHLEFRLDSRGPMVMEVAVRTPGDYLFDLIGLAYDFDPYRVMVQLALGMAPDLPVDPAPVGHAGVWFPTARPGTVTTIHGVSEVAEFPAVHDISIDVNVGDQVFELLSSRHRIGHVLVNGNTAHERDRAMDFARRTIQIEVD